MRLLFKIFIRPMEYSERRELRVEKNYKFYERFSGRSAAGKTDFRISGWPFSVYEAIYGDAASGFASEAIALAGTILSVLPLLFFYIIFQRQFVESIESSGITGE